MLWAAFELFPVSRLTAGNKILVPVRQTPSDKTLLATKGMIVLYAG
jgi:hypothetical protein